MKRLIPLFIVAAFIGLAGCGFSAEERLTCKDILAEGEVGFSEVANFLKDCGSCHTANNPIYGHDFSTPQAAYKSSLHKADIIYTQMVTGMMPPGDSPRVEDEYLQRFRTWYCRGALYEDQ